MTEIPCTPIYCCNHYRTLTAIAISLNLLAGLALIIFGTTCCIREDFTYCGHEVGAIYMLSLGSVAFIIFFCFIGSFSKALMNIRHEPEQSETS